ncbi:MAG: ATP-grasp domain-containing protein [Thermoanaerobaculia bacterium]
MTRPAAVLLTDAPSNANLAVVRSLGRRGIPIGVCGIEGEFNLSFYSRYASECFTVPSPNADPSGYLRAVTAILRAGRYSVLFPTTERTIKLISAWRDVIPEQVRLPIPDREALDVALDKEQTMALAKELGVPLPATWCPAGPEELPTLGRELPYPVIVKPRETNFLAPDGRLRKSAYVIATSPAELARGYRSIHERVPRPLIQEVVAGDGTGVFSVWNRGTPVAWFAHRRLREEDPRGSRASAAVSVPLEPTMTEWSMRLLKALGWHGVAMVEFKRNAQTGQAWLMEINGRFWGSLALALAAGVDFPYYLYLVATGDPVDAPSSYPAGVTARDAVGELKHFVNVLWRSRRAGVTTMPGRLQTLLQAPIILDPRRNSYNWTPDDPKPGRREWLHFLRGVTRGR